MKAKKHVGGWNSEKNIFIFQLMHLLNIREVETGN